MRNHESKRGTEVNAEQLSGCLASTFWKTKADS